MKRGHFLTIFLTVLMIIALIPIVFLLAKSPPDKDPRLDYSSYSGNHDGYLAWFELLEASGYDVEHYGHRLGELSERYQSAIIAADAIDVSDWLTPHTVDSEHFHAWIEAGGTAIALSNSFEGVQLGLRIHSLQELSSAKHMRYAVFKTGIPIGRGHLYLLSSADVLANANIAASHHAELAIDLVHGSRSGRIAFDETLHGYGVHDTLIALLPPSVLWGLGLTLGAFLLWLFGVSWRVGPSHKTMPATATASREFLLALAGLIEAGAAWPELIAHVQQTLRERRIFYPSAKPTEQATLDKLLTMQPSRSQKNFIFAVKTLQHFKPYQSP